MYVLKNFFFFFKLRFLLRMSLWYAWSGVKVFFLSFLIFIFKKLRAEVELDWWI
jgi:hypothetical protein